MPRPGRGRSRACSAAAGPGWGRRRALVRQLDPGHARAGRPRTPGPAARTRARRRARHPRPRPPPPPARCVARLVQPGQHGLGEVRPDRRRDPLGRRAAGQPRASSTSAAASREASPRAAGRGLGRRGTWRCRAGMPSAVAVSCSLSPRNQRHTTTSRSSLRNERTAASTARVPLVRLGVGGRVGRAPARVERPQRPRVPPLARADLVAGLVGDDPQQPRQERSVRRGTGRSPATPSRTPPAPRRRCPARRRTTRRPGSRQHRAGRPAARTRPGHLPGPGGRPDRVVRRRALVRRRTAPTPPGARRFPLEWSAQSGARGRSAAHPRVPASSMPPIRWPPTATASSAPSPTSSTSTATRSAGRCAPRPADAGAASSTGEWGSRLIRGWDEAWFDLPLTRRRRPRPGRARRRARPGHDRRLHDRAALQGDAGRGGGPARPAPRSCSTATTSRPTATSPPASPRSAG